MASASVFPVRNTTLRVYFSIVDGSDALITGWTGKACQISKDGAAYAASTASPVEIGSTGTGYIDLTATEMDAKAVTLDLSVTNAGAVHRVITIITGGLTEIAAAVAAAILLTPANLLKTNASGQVEASNLSDISVEVNGDGLDGADGGDTAGRATTPRNQIAQIYRYLVNKSTINRSTGEHLLLKDDSATTMLSGTTSTTDVVTTVGKKT